jgi:transcriptional regulator with GAF, ATPase, and Fis domain
VSDANVGEKNKPHDDPAPGVCSGADGEGGDVRQAHTSGGVSMDSGVARELSELARELQAENDPQQVMQRVVDAAVEEIPGATVAAITLLQRGQFSSPVHSDELAVRIGEIEVRNGEGPCVDTSRQELTVRSDDLRSEQRWPRFAAEVVELGVLSAISFQLFVEADSMGALDVYSDTAHAFDDDAENIGLLLASHAAIAMSAIREVTNLHTAMDTRDLIGQAKGILMERYKVSAARAFDLLLLSSHNTNTKLRDVAENLTSAGELTVPRPRRR